MDIHTLYVSYSQIAERQRRSLLVKVCACAHAYVHDLYVHMQTAVVDVPMFSAFFFKSQNIS
jgi:hypothetical protein